MSASLKYNLCKREIGWHFSNTWSVFCGVRQQSDRINVGSRNEDREDQRAVEFVFDDKMIQNRLHYNKFDAAKHNLVSRRLSEIHIRIISNSRFLSKLQCPFNLNYGELCCTLCKNVPFQASE